MSDYPKISDMLGVTMASVENVKGEVLRFTAEDGRVWEFCHLQDCCETVTIEDITGDLANLVGAPLLMADESSNEKGDPVPHESADSWTWTFYKFATIKGYVDVRWLGESNGYYGEKVSFRRVA